MPQYINPHNLPEPLVRALTRDAERPRGAKEIGVSELISPVRKVLLERRHDSEIVVDISDRVYALLGTAVHNLLAEKAQPMNVLEEERLEVEVDGWKIIGHPDLYREPETLTDYKCTSVWAFILGDKPEWEAQLNVYAYMYRQYGFAVNALEIIPILRDWKRHDASKDGYPPVPTLVKNIPLWPEGFTKGFIKGRVSLYEAEMEVADDALVLCTEQERWTRSPKYAVTKKGRKRAVRLYDDRADAEAHAATDTQLYVEDRPGEETRCLHYCDAAPFCSFYRERDKGEEHESR